MPDTATLTMFSAASLLLLVSPGPAVLFILARSIDQGWKAGVVSCLGLSVGLMFHVSGAVLGISALILASVTVFNLIKYGGAAYLIFLGVRRFLEKDKKEDFSVTGRKKLSTLFYQGIIVDVLNPKVAMFFLAFLPQFVNTSAGNISGQLLILGILFIIFATATGIIYALFAGYIGGRLRNSSAFSSYQRYFSGIVYIGLGIAAALSGSVRK